MSVAIREQYASLEQELGRDTRTGQGEKAKQSLLERCEQQAAQTKGQRKSVKALRKSVKALRDQDYKEAALRAVDAAEADPQDASARHVLAVSLEKLGQLHKALESYEIAQQLDPTDPDIYLNLGLLAWKLDMIEAAEKFFRIHLKILPNSVEGLNNLGGALRDQGRFDDAIEVLRGAIYLHQDSGMLWNSLGTVMVEAEDHANAMTFYEEAVRIEPDLGRAYHNMGYALSVTGPLERATAMFEEGLERAASASDAIEGRHGRALCLIGSGRLEEGWREYESRHDPLFHDQTIFQVGAPLWDGAPLVGKRLLLVGEQGLGDEILFMNTIGELIEEVGPDGEVFIACEKRLVPLFKKAFPNATVGRHVSRRHNGRVLRLITWREDIGDIDFYAPFGSALQYRRNTLQDFPAEPPRFKPDPARVAHWRAAFEAEGPGPYVGVAWRSMIMNVKRSKFFAPLEDWAHVFKTPGVKFINLQYGDVEEELQTIRGFGADIWNPEGIDLTNDLEDVAALCAALDQAVSITNASFNIAAAVGVPAWTIHGPVAWPRLGTDGLPWYPNAKVYVSEQHGEWTKVLKRLAADLAAQYA
ncbi:MAG: tetratricopeptide repeat protein [Pseudomonadota bacterium]